MEKDCFSCAYCKPLYYYIRGVRMRKLPIGLCCIKMVTNPQRSIAASIVDRSKRCCRAFKEGDIPWSETIDVEDKELTAFIETLKAEAEQQAETGSPQSEQEARPID